MLAGMSIGMGGTMRIELSVNDLPVVAEYRDQDAEQLLLPLVRHWGELQSSLDRRMVVFLAAAPGTGKTTLALALQELARQRDIALQAVGLDGFHFPNAYLDTHTHVEDGKEITLRSRKGAEFTFDAEGLRRYVENVLSTPLDQEPDKWPVYSRVAHDPLPDALEIGGKIILVEGNYLLLPQEPWASIAPLADEAVFLDAPEELLRTRLVERKIAGGSSDEEAVAWYEASDGKNVRAVLAGHIPATHELRLSTDGSIVRV